MDDALGVGRGQRLRQLLGNRQPTGPGERRDLAARQQLAQTAAGHQLEGEVVGLGPRQVLVDPADIRMVELREDARLAQEARTRLGADAVATQRLERHPPLQPLVDGGVHRAHAALPDLLLDQEVGDAGADERHGTRLGNRQDESVPRRRPARTAYSRGARPP